MRDIIKPIEVNLFSEKKLKVLEEQFGFLPDDYKVFLRNINGGSLIKDSLIVNSIFYDVSQLYGFTNNENKWSDLGYYLNQYDLMSRFPKGTMPIGDNHGGNYYLLNLNNGDNYGAIYYWNHEDTDVFNGDLSNLNLLSSDFNSFIFSLFQEEEKINVKITETDDDFIIE